MFIPYYCRDDFEKSTVVDVCKKFLHSEINFLVSPIYLGVPEEKELQQLKSSLPIVQGNYLLCMKKILDSSNVSSQHDWTIEFHDLLKKFDCRGEIYSKLFAPDFALRIGGSEEISQMILSYTGDAPSYQVVINRLLTRPEFRD